MLLWCGSVHLLGFLARNSRWEAQHWPRWWMIFVWIQQKYTSEISTQNRMYIQKTRMKMNREREREIVTINKATWAIFESFTSQFLIRYYLEIAFFRQQFCLTNNQPVFVVVRAKRNPITNSNIPNRNIEIENVIWSFSFFWCFAPNVLHSQI